MDTAVVPSTFLLTLLMFVGLFFFIRASSKDRTETVQLRSQQPEASLMPKLQQYFVQRSYQVKAVDSQQNQVTLEGFVRPSKFLAVFLTLLAATGIFCLVLVLAQLFGGFNPIFFGLLLLAPAAGIFYWKTSGRSEQVVLHLEPTTGDSDSTGKITVVAHRDEVIELQKALKLEVCE